MPTSPRVTVFIPAFNAERYIGESIASVVEQSFQDFSLLVIDDGSTDGTREIVEALASRDERVNLVSRENRGRPATRNQGLEMASGDYLARNFADSPCITIFCFNPKAMAITDIKLDRVSVVGGGSVYPSVQNFLLACRKEGLSCVLTTLLCECETEILELLDIPAPWGTAAAIPIGYPVGKGHGPITRQGISQLVNQDQWDAPLIKNE